jgi:hypothetical protein
LQQPGCTSVFANREEASSDLPLNLRSSPFETSLSNADNSAAIGIDKKPIQEITTGNQSCIRTNKATLEIQGRPQSEVLIIIEKLKRIKNEEKRNKRAESVQAKSIMDIHGDLFFVKTGSLRHITRP